MSIFARALEGLIQRTQQRSGGWLVLVLDASTERAVNSLFTAQQLLRLRVALVCDVQKQRTHVPGAPALYFVSPSAEAFAAIVSDCRRGIYGSYFVAFNTLRTDIASEFAKAFSEEPALAKLIVSVQVLPLTVRQLNPLVFVADCCGKSLGSGENPVDHPLDHPLDQEDPRNTQGGGVTGSPPNSRMDGREEPAVPENQASVAVAKALAHVRPCITPTLIALLRPPSLSRSVSGLLSYLFSLGASYGSASKPAGGPATSGTQGEARGESWDGVARASNVSIRLPAIYAIGRNSARVCQEAMTILTSIGIRILRKPMSVLLVADRCCDPLALLKHNMSYGCLVADTLYVQDGNRVELGSVAEGGEAGEGRPSAAADVTTEPFRDRGERSYVLDSRDSLYSTIFTSHFTEAAASINSAVKAYKARYAESTSAGTASPGLWDLGKMKREKEECDAHTEIGGKVLKLAAERKIHELCEYETDPSKFVREIIQTATTVAASPGFVRGAERERDAERLVLQYLLSTEANVELLAGPSNAIGGSILEAITLLGKLTGQSTEEVEGELHDIATFILGENTAAGQAGTGPLMDLSAKSGSSGSSGSSKSPGSSGSAGSAGLASAIGSATAVAAVNASTAVSGKIGASTSAGGLTGVGSLSNAVSAAASFVRTGMRQFVGSGNLTLARAVATVLSSLASQKTVQSSGAEFRYHSFSPRPLQAELGGPVHEICLYITGCGSLAEATELGAAVAETEERRRQAAGAGQRADSTTGRQQRMVVRYGCDFMM